MLLTKWRDDSRRSFEVRDNPPPDWEELNRNPSLSEVKLFGVKQPASNPMLFQLALAIQSHPRITKITFWNCEIQDVGMLCLALTYKKHQPVSLYFGEFCELALGVAETLRFLLAANLVESLAIELCSLSVDFQPILSEGLRRNQSLRSFMLVLRPTPTFHVREGLREMLIHNQNTGQLALSFPSYVHSELFQNPEQKMTSLTTLSLRSSTFHLPSMESLMLTCFVTASLEVLELRSCTFAENSLELLVRTLSNHRVIKTLILYSFVPSVPVEIDLGTIQVHKLVLRDIEFTRDSFSQTVESIANNNVIKCLDISSGIFDDDDDINNQAFRKVCDVFLRQNRGPSELAIEVFDEDANAMLISAMADNTSIKSLTVDQVGAAELVSFAEGVANMNGLRRLGFLDGCMHTAAFFKNLKESLERNSAIWSLSFEDIGADNALVRPYLPDIHYMLAINRVGRRQAMAARMPLGVWAHLLAKSSNARDGLYFVLKERPDIIAIPSRKRKDRCDD